MSTGDWFEPDNKPDLSREEFENALNESFTDKTFQAGDRVTGTVASITGSYVFLDLGAKSEGIIHRAEFLDEAGELTVSVGDRVDTTVMSTGDELLCSFRMRKKDQTRELLQDAYENSIPVQGRVTQTNKGGFVIDLGKQRAFCPISQIDVLYVDDPEEYVGQTFHFHISRYDPSGRDIVVSRSSFLKKEAELNAEKTLKTLEPGQILPGKVTRITEIGAFVDIGGLDGLIHVSELSWGRVRDPGEIVSTGQELTVKVLTVDRDRKRIGLSLREIQDNPWEDDSLSLQPETRFEGEINQIKSAGLEVVIHTNITGFVPASMTGLPRRENLMKTFQIGQMIPVRVVEADVGKRRLILAVTDPDETSANENYREYLENVSQDQETTPGGERMGTLGMKLAEALKKKQQREKEG